MTHVDLWQVTFDLCLSFLICRMQERAILGFSNGDGRWEMSLSPWKRCANCVCMSACGGGLQNYLGSEVKPDLMGHTYCWSPAGKYCSLNMPGVSLVLPNQFLEDRGLGHRISTCPSVYVSQCLTGFPNTFDVICGMLQKSS